MKYKSELGMKEKWKQTQNTRRGKSEVVNQKDKIKK
jgi:hypothetical protein